MMPLFHMSGSCGLIVTSYATGRYDSEEGKDRCKALLENVTLQRP